MFDGSHALGGLRRRLEGWRDSSQRTTPEIKQQEVTPDLREHYNCERGVPSKQKQTLVTLLIIIPSKWNMAVLQALVQTRGFFATSLA